MNSLDFINTKEKYNNTVSLHPKFLFRGQCDSSWALTPSLTRIVQRKNFSREKALQLERELVNKFSISASNLIDTKYTIKLSLASFAESILTGNFGTIDFLGWFPMMQHFQAPTRCLDWSTSYLVSLYFACQNLNTDGMIWVVNFYQAEKQGEIRMRGSNDFQNKMADKDFTENILRFMMTSNTNERIEAQQGRFSICTNPLSNHEAILNEYNAIEEKIIIPKEYKEQILIHLYSMNINARTLFPGLDGLGKSMLEYSELWDSTSIIS